MTAGLVAEVVGPELLRPRTLQLAATIAAYSPLAVRHAKSLLALAEPTSMEDRLAVERALVHNYATTSFDAIEGLQAFADRRPPKYRGA